jgi:hypothetical protein
MTLDPRPIKIPGFYQRPSIDPENNSWNEEHVVAQAAMDAFPAVDRSAFKLDMVNEAPVIDTDLPENYGPFRMFGFYNGSTDTVQLAWTNRYGDRFVPVLTTTLDAPFGYRAPATEDDSL